MKLKITTTKRNRQKHKTRMTKHYIAAVQHDGKNNRTNVDNKVEEPES